MKIIINISTNEYMTNIVLEMEMIIVERVERAEVGEVLEAEQG